MNSNPTEISGFEQLSRFVSSASLCVSLLLGLLIVGSIRPGLYGGTAVLLALILAAQFAALILAVVLPAVVLFFCRRLRMSRQAWLLLAIAVLVATAEAVAVSLIPVTGRC
jgi:hypothetical protein